MSIVVLKLPDVKSEAEARPNRCPSCKGETFQRWGGSVRRIRDPHVRYALVYRYRCGECGHTFRHYPRGVDQAQQSQRLRKLAAYKVVAGKLHLEHQICQFHVRRWVGRTLHELKDSLPEQWQGLLQEAGQILQELPVEGSRRLLELWKQIAEPRSGRDQPNSPVDKLRDLLIRLSNHWENYRIFDWQPEVPWTNNTTEQVIGRMKMRSRTVRGYKTEAGMPAGLLAAASGMC
jgi:transposase-like protein